MWASTVIEMGPVSDVDKMWDKLKVHVGFWQPWPFLWLCKMSSLCVNHQCCAVIICILGHSNLFLRPPLVMCHFSGTFCGITMIFFAQNFIMVIGFEYQIHD